jgi:hypothetical protein
MPTNLQQLDFENQRGSAWNRRRVPVVPVRDVGRASQSGLPTYLHLLHAFSPRGRISPRSPATPWRPSQRYFSRYFNAKPPRLILIL